MKFTLDTNVFLGGLLEETQCRDVIQEYTKSSNSFITEKVHLELATKRGQWAMIIGFLARRWDGQQKLEDLFEEIKTFVGDVDDENPLMRCTNLIEYLENKKNNARNFDLKKERERINTYLGGYLSNIKPRHPSLETTEKFKTDLENIKRIINQHALVDGPQDKKIILEIFLVTKLFSDSVTFLTKNINDFKVGESEWKTHLNNIIIVYPNTTCFSK